MAEPFGRGDIFKGRSYTPSIRTSGSSTSESRDEAIDIQVEIKELARHVFDALTYLLLSRDGTGCKAACGVLGQENSRGTLLSFPVGFYDSDGQARC
jgi:hypothetical protein